MAKKRKRIDTPHPGQLNLLDLVKKSHELIGTPSTEGSMNIEERLRRELLAGIKQCHLSRWEIAGQMSHLMGREVTKYMIDAWTAESKEGHRVHGDAIPAFCVVTGYKGPIRVINEPVGVYAMPGPDALRSEIQRLDEEMKKIKNEKQKRMMFLKEMEGK